MTAAVLVSEFIAAPISSLLMEYNIWLPLVAGLISQILGVLIAIALPETLPPPTIDATNSLVADETAEDLRKSIKVWKKIEEIFEFLFRDKAVAFLVIGFLVLRLGRQSMAILVQYISKRYEWSLSQVIEKNFLSLHNMLICSRQTFFSPFEQQSTLVSL